MPQQQQVHVLQLQQHPAATKKSFPNAFFDNRVIFITHNLNLTSFLSFYLG